MWFPFRWLISDFIVSTQLNGSSSVRAATWMIRNDPERLRSAHFVFWGRHSTQEPSLSKLRGHQQNVESPQGGFIYVYNVFENKELLYVDAYDVWVIVFQI